MENVSLGTYNLLRKELGNNGQILMRRMKSKVLSLGLSYFSPRDSWLKGKVCGSLALDCCFRSYWERTPDVSISGEFMQDIGTFLTHSSHASFVMSQLIMNLKSMP